MNHTEVLSHFKQHEVSSWRQRTLLEVDATFRQEREEWIAAFLNHFERWCSQLLEKQRRGEKGEIGYISYHLLRTRLQEKEAVYLVEGMDHTWWLDKQPYQGYYAVDWAFSSWMNCIQELRSAAQSYGGKIRDPQLEKIARNECEYFHRYVIELIRLAMPKAAKLDAYQQLQREEIFEVRVGEYMDHSVLVYKEDRRQRESEVVREWIRERQDNDYAYEAYERLDLSDEHVIGLDFRYSTFRKCHFKQIDMRLSMLVGTRWEDCVLHQADLSESLLHGACFDGSDMRGANLQKVVGGRSLEASTHWGMPSLDAVSFAHVDLRKANLSYADLPQANLSSADLSGGILHEVNLERAILCGANLSDTQMQGVNLRYADLRGADLTRANLEGADLTGALVERVVLPSVEWKRLQEGTKKWNTLY